MARISSSFLSTLPQIRFGFELNPDSTGRKEEIGKDLGSASDDILRQQKLAISFPTSHLLARNVKKSLRLFRFPIVLEVERTRLRVSSFTVDRFKSAAITLPYSLNTTLQPDSNLRISLHDLTLVLVSQCHSGCNYWGDFGRRGPNMAEPTRTTEAPCLIAC